LLKFRRRSSTWGNFGVVEEGLELANAVYWMVRLIVAVWMVEPPVAVTVTA
jgi:hypothetical protein